MPGGRMRNINSRDYFTRASVGLRAAARALDLAPSLYLQTFSATLAELNAGKTIVADRAGHILTPVDLLLVFNGTFTTATDIRLSDTNGTPVDILTLAIAGATANTRIGNTSTSNITWGAGFLAALTAHKGIQIRKTGSNAAGGTSISGYVAYLIG